MYKLLLIFVFFPSLCLSQVADYGDAQVKSDFFSGNVDPKGSLGDTVVRSSGIKSKVKVSNAYSNNKMDASEGNQFEIPKPKVKPKVRRKRKTYKKKKTIENQENQRPSVNLDKYSPMNQSEVEQKHQQMLESHQRKVLDLTKGGEKDKNKEWSGPEGADITKAKDLDKYSNDVELGAMDRIEAINKALNKIDMNKVRGDEDRDGKKDEGLASF